jgi:hypothetical protein
MVPDEVALQFHQLHVQVVEFADNFGAEVIVEQ